MITDTRREKGSKQKRGKYTLAFGNINCPSVLVASTHEPCIFAERARTLVYMTSSEAFVDAFAQAVGVSVRNDSMAKSFST
jgi:hypothetical protein